MSDDDERIVGMEKDDYIRHFLGRLGGPGSGAYPMNRALTDYLRACLRHREHDIGVAVILVSTLLGAGREVTAEDIIERLAPLSRPAGLPFMADRPARDN